MLKSSPLYNRLLLLALAGFVKKPTVIHIHEVWTNTLKTTKAEIGLKRARDSLREQLEVEIRVNKSPRFKNEGGIFYVQNWGVIDRVKLYEVFRDDLLLIGFQETEIRSLEEVIEASELVRVEP